ncbi:MAG: HAD family hydrolase [Acidobacteriota bacterium]
MSRAEAISPDSCGAIDAPGLSAVVFDLDGTLIDSYGAITECFNHACVSLGFEPRSEDEVRRLVGHGLESLMSDAVGSGQMLRAVRLFRHRYDEVCEERTQLLPGAATTVAALDRRGLALGVATNKPTGFAVRLLRALGLSPPIKVVHGPGADIPPKPDPAMLLRVLHDLDVRPEDALFVGDMSVDVETARRAGVRVWLVPTGSASPDDVARAGADRVLPGLDGLPAALAGLSRSS